MDGLIANWGRDPQDGASVSFGGDVDGDGTGDQLAFTHAADDSLGLFLGR